MKHRLLLLGVATSLLSLASVHAQGKKAYTIGLIAKSQSNPVFQAARVGAEQAAKDLGSKNGISIKIDWRTPNDEDAQKQAEALEQLVLAGANGIAVSCSDANKLTDAINSAVKNGAPVATYDANSPASIGIERGDWRPVRFRCSREQAVCDLWRR